MKSQSLSSLKACSKFFEETWKLSHFVNTPKKPSAKNNLKLIKFFRTKSTANFCKNNSLQKFFVGTLKSVSSSLMSFSFLNSLNSETSFI